MAVEFDCAECGQHIVDVIHDEVQYPAVCAWCLNLPGWDRDPALLKMLAPELALERAQKAIGESLFQFHSPSRFQRFFLRIFGWALHSGGKRVLAAAPIAIYKGESIVPARRDQP